MLQHIAIEVADKEQAAQFFSEVLGLSRRHASLLPPRLNQAIFGRNEAVEMEIWADDHLNIEVFVTGEQVPPSYRHLCLTVPDKAAFADKCTAHGLTVITPKKGDRELLFVKDFSGNMYEIKER